LKQRAELAKEDFNKLFSGFMSKALSWFDVQKSFSWHAKITEAIIAKPSECRRCGRGFQHIRIDKLPESNRMLVNVINVLLIELV
jgi:hypothetical protein